MRRTAMRQLNLNLVADNFTTANVTGKGNGVTVEIDPQLQWARAGLVQLSAALAGVAAMLPRVAGSKKRASKPLRLPRWFSPRRG
jgi:hypothetical protein